jgi:DedD protein
MDRALKERIIGAVVLVAFVVLVVPVFLDGPENEAAVLTERIPLPGQDPTETKTIVLERDRTEPVPAPVSLPQPEEADDEPAELAATDASDDTPTNDTQAAPDESPQDATPDVPVAETGPDVVETDEPAQRSQPARSDTSPVRVAEQTATGMWAVQLGSFSNEANANRLAADLRQQGFAAFLSRTDDGKLHRVRVGPQKDRPSAEAMAGRLADAGHRGQVVPHP